MGQQVPRVRSESLAHLPSRGPDALAFADLFLGPDERLMPWQRFVLTEGMRTSEGGRYAHPLVSVLVPRQQGKSYVMRLRVLAGMYLWGESWVTMSQKLALTEEHLEWAMRLVSSTPDLRSKVSRMSRTNGRKFIELTNGGRWLATAATPDSARGLSGNLWVDEIREVTPEGWQAANPVTTAVANPQIWVSSNAGDAHSTVLNDLRTRALAQPKPRIGWFEWSADPSLPASSEEGWLQANPAIGHGRVTLETIRDAYSMDAPRAFETERLCRWTDALESPWPHGAFERCRVDELRLEPGPATWLAVDVSPNRLRADLVAGQQLEDGRTAVGLVQTWTSETAVDDLVIAQDVAKWARTYSARAVAFDRWTGAAIASRLATAGIPVGDVSGAAFAQACDETLAAMVNGRLVHTGQPVLTDHMNACARKSLADGGWRIVRRGSGGYISAACALVMVAHYAATPAPSMDIIVV